MQCSRFNLKTKVSFSTRVCLLLQMTHICLMVSQRLRRRFGASSLCWKRHENKQFVWFCSLPVHYYKCCRIMCINALHHHNHCHHHHRYCECYQREASQRDGNCQQEQAAPRNGDRDFILHLIPYFRGDTVSQRSLQRHQR